MRLWESSMLDRKAKRKIIPYILIAPACILLAIFAYGIGNGIIQGFGIMPFLDMYTPTLDYYIESFLREDLASSISYSFYLALVSASLATVGGTILCAAICRAKTGRAVQLLGVQVPLMTAHALIATCVVSLFA